MRTGFFDVYIVRSENEPPHFYAGFTGNLEARLVHRHSGGDPHTARHRPRRIKAAIALSVRHGVVAADAVFQLAPPSARRQIVVAS